MFAQGLRCVVHVGMMLQIAVWIKFSDVAILLNSGIQLIKSFEFRGTRGMRHSKKKFEGFGGEKFRVSSFEFPETGTALNGRRQGDLQSAIR